MNSSRVEGVILTLSPYISHLSHEAKLLAVSLALVQGCHVVVQILQAGEVRA